MPPDSRVTRPWKNIHVHYIGGRWERAGKNAPEKKSLFQQIPSPLWPISHLHRYLDEGGGDSEGWRGTTPLSQTVLFRFFFFLIVVSVNCFFFFFSNRFLTYLERKPFTKHRNPFSEFRKSAKLKPIFKYYTIVVFCGRGEQHTLRTLLVSNSTRFVIPT